MAELIWEGKYLDPDRRHKAAPLKIALPFQTVETVNESFADREKGRLDLFGKQDSEWKNRLIWGDKKYVLPSLLPEFAGKVDLIYIDPPFDTGANFSFTIEMPSDSSTEDASLAKLAKEPSAIEQKAYRDTWGEGIDSYLRWLNDTLLLMRELLSESGTIYVHLDWHVGHYAKVLLDEVFGQENFMNDITWYYYNKFAPESKCFPRASDRILAYTKCFGDHTFHRQEEARDKPVKQLKRKFIGGKAINVRDDEGNVQYVESTARRVDDVWRISMLQPADKTEYVRYQTQKPLALLSRVIQASSNPGDLVLDCFVGSGTTAVAAEQLGRRWITCDLGRFAIHTTRKRLLQVENVRPFVVQNLGKYERQHWQKEEFGERAESLELDYRKFILELYHAEPITGYAWLHGVRNGRLVHVGGVEAPVSVGDVAAICAEFRKAVGSGKNAPKTNGVDVLGWEFAFEINEVAKKQAQDAGVNISFKKIPREVLEKKAVEQGDIKFFELAALEVDVKTEKRKVTLDLASFVMSPDDIPEDVRTAITHWSQWIDYWAVDWDNHDDTFHNMWQSYRTRKDKTLKLSAVHSYSESGEYRVLVKVIDLLGNDTTKALVVKVT